MGMQQILLIVLSVIIVGVAVAVGITMFSTQARNANRQAVISDMNSFAATAMGYYKTPTSMGGGGRDFTTNSSLDLYKWLGFGSDGKTNNDNGSYTVSTADSIVTFTGIGTEKASDGSLVEATLIFHAYNDSIYTTVVN